jgi:hypothetical protein
VRVALALRRADAVGELESATASLETTPPGHIQSTPTTFVAGDDLNPVINLSARSRLPVSAGWFARRNVSTILVEGYDGDKARASPRTASPG